jgi:hypothetical protein
VFQERAAQEQADPLEAAVVETRGQERLELFLLAHPGEHRLDHPFVGGPWLRPAKDRFVFVPDMWQRAPSAVDAGQDREVGFLQSEEVFDGGESRRVGLRGGLHGGFGGWPQFYGRMGPAFRLQFCGGSQKITRPLSGSTRGKRPGICRPRR